MANLSAEVTLEWADSEYLFALKAKQIEELESILNEGIGRICARVMSGIDFTYKHLRETIRLGLIGGGLDAVSAKRLVETYVDGHPIGPFKVNKDGVKIKDDDGRFVPDPMSSLSVANAILNAVYFGWNNLPKVDAGERESPTV